MLELDVVDKPFGQTSAAAEFVALLDDNSEDKGGGGGKLFSDEKLDVGKPNGG